MELDSRGDATAAGIGDRSPVEGAGRRFTAVAGGSHDHGVPADYARAESKQAGCPGGCRDLKTTTDNSGLQMSLPARAENVAVVRHALAGLAERLGMDEPSLADLKTVVTEACMNVVVHAYPEGEDGLLEVEAAAHLEGIKDVGRAHVARLRP